MKKTMKIMNNQKGFTLVELIIVVVILAILAAVIIPQLRGSTDDAKVSTLETNLSGVRGALELYRVQHDAYPGAKKNHTSGGTTAAHTTEEEAFIYQLTKYSDSAGNTNDTYDATTFKYGPYTKKFPKNPLANAATTTDAASREVEVDIIETKLGASAADDSKAKGWYYVTATGEFFANNTAYADR